MAKLAEYRFDNERDCMKAYDKIADGVNWERAYSSALGFDCYYITIKDSCSDITLAGQICRAHGGVSV